MSKRESQPETSDDAVADTDSYFTEPIHWREGLLSGANATTAMGLVIMVTDMELLRVAVAGLYGQEGNLVVGWIAHLIHGLVFGLLFAVVLSEPVLGQLRHQMWKTIVAGAVYGVILTVLGAGIIMPIWLQLIDFSEALPIPNITTASLLWHVVYGTVLGAIFSFLTD